MRRGTQALGINSAGPAEDLRHADILARHVASASQDPEARQGVDESLEHHNEAGKAAIKEAHARQAALIAELLEPYADAIGRTGQTPAQLARFVVTVAMDLKYGSENRARLDELLYSLRSSVIALTASG